MQAFPPDLGKSCPATRKGPRRAAGQNAAKTFLLRGSRKSPQYQRLPSSPLTTPSPFDTVTTVQNPGARVAVNARGYPSCPFMARLHPACDQAISSSSSPPLAANSKHLLSPVGPRAVPDPQAAFRQANPERLLLPGQGGSSDGKAGRKFHSRERDSMRFAGAQGSRTGNRRGDCLRVEFSLQNIKSEARIVPLQRRELNGG